MTIGDHWQEHFTELYEKYRKEQALDRKLTHIMAAIDDLKAQADAIVALLRALTDKIAATPASTDAQVVAITAELKTAADAANAVVNPPAPTPVEPPPAA